MSAPSGRGRGGGGVRLSEALDNMQLAYNPITKQLHFVSPKVDKTAEDTADDLDKLSKKSSFSDEGNFSISTCEKSDTSDSPKSTLNWGGSVSGHQRGKDGGSFSSTVSSLSECSLGSSASKEDELGEETPEQEQAKLKKKGLSGFFSRGVFPWKSNSSAKQNSGAVASWRLFGRGGGGTRTEAVAGATGDTPGAEPAPAPPAPPAPAPAPHHRRQGSAASDKQFEELVASSIALIQHDRPSNLPAKTTEEAMRHKAEHQRILEAARRRVERESAARAARHVRALRHEERLASHAREWAAILPEWDALKNAKRTQELWWSGLPPAVRGRVWRLAIGNRRGITRDVYRASVERARRRIRDARDRRDRLKVNRECGCGGEKPLGLPRNFSEQNLKSHDAEPAQCCSKSNPNLLEAGESPMELISLDIARTFPALCIFQPGGPYFSALHELLAAYACYRPDVGYVQGMSFIAAMLILNMEAEAAFVCFANLLEEPVLRAAYTRDGDAMQRLWAAYTRLLEHNIPALAACVPAPELYLLEWVYTAFAKAMPLDAACRVWDLMLRDGGSFLFNTALGILHLYQAELRDMDFISAAQFLTKLPEELDAEALFRSIAGVSMTLDGLSFQQLAERAAPPDPDPDPDREGGDERSGGGGR